MHIFPWFYAICHYSAQLINTEQERDRLSIEINRLGLQCQQLKSTQERLVTEHSKTLERVNELWKQKWPGAYDEVCYTHLPCFVVDPIKCDVLLSTQQAWEEKHITLQLVCYEPMNLAYSICYTLPFYMSFLYIYNTNLASVHHVHPCTYNYLWCSLCFPPAKGSDGLAGFSVVGGRDQPQLPNPGAFIVTTVIPGGPADGLVKSVHYHSIMWLSCDLSCGYHVTIMWLSCDYYHVTIM